ncbi:toxin-antitoxin system YwqK family antitoxin [Leptospira sp. WS39.C2]
MAHQERFPTNLPLVRTYFLSSLLILLLCLSCGKLRVDAGNKDLSEDKNGFLLFKGKPFTGIFVTENPILSETYESEYYKGVPHGSYTVKTFSGIVLEERNIRYGQKHGKQISYFPSGKVRQSSEYEMGIPVGEHFEYYDNGQMASYQTFFASGKPKVAKKWNKRGQIYLNHVFLETGESFGRPGSKLCEPVPEADSNQTKTTDPKETTKL